MTAITQNGVFPAGSLATTYLYYPGTTNGRKIRTDIAPYAEAMATAFLLEFGKPLYATDGARDFATQVQLKKEKGVYAATPGTSNHGWARAFDLASGVQNFGSAEHKWLRENAHRWGFVHPSWAHDGNPGNGQQEAWHWEFVGGGSKSRRILRPGKGEVGLGDSGDKVRKVQSLLNERVPGLSMRVDGGFGLLTAAAVIRFQDQAGLTATGRVSTATMQLLEDPVFLKRGSTRRNQVIKLQRYLKKQVAPKLVVDGVYGDGTVAAVRAWQKKEGMTETGYIGLHSLKRLKDAGVYK